MRIMAMALFIIILAALPLHATGQFSPQPGMTIAGAPALVIFRWPSDGTTMYYLEVLANGRAIVSKPVSGESMALNLPPNTYQWRIQTFVENQYRPSSDFITFTVISTTAFNFDGRSGPVGPPGTMGYANTGGYVGSAQAGSPGGDGGNGEDGKDVAVTIQDAGDYLQVDLTGANTGSSFLLSRSSAPLVISARGGKGGDGGIGGDGGSYSQVYNPNYPSGHYAYGYGGAGGPGGNGGDGGNGGNVTITCRGGDFKKYVTADVTGGKGGQGGRGGLGGNPGGASGYTGQAGRDGMKGQVTYGD